jgi:hypothetical protein
MGPVRGLLMKPFLIRLFYRINFTQFIQEAERRATEATAWAPRRKTGSRQRPLGS